MNSTITLWQRIRRTPYQSIASIFMIFVTLLVMALFLLMAGMSSALLTYFETKPQLTIFFKDEKDKISIDNLSITLKNTGKVAGVNYISKEQALAIYKEQNKNDPLLLEMVTADILPASLEISATSPKFLAELSEIVKTEPGIDEIVYQKDVVDSLISWTSTIRKAGVVFLFILLLSTFFILFTNIGMKISYKKDEIEILKLVGATPWYIKRPFIYEGIAYGAIGAFFSWALSSIVVLYINPFLTSFLRGIPQLYLLQYEDVGILIWPPTIGLFMILFFILLLSGFIIGFLGSFFALNRYMKY